MHTEKTLRNTLIALAAMLTVAVVGGGLLVGGLVLAVSLMFAGVGPQHVSGTQANNSLAVSELKYDDCTHTVEGTLTGRRDSNVNQPVTVTITAAVPGEPTTHRSTAKAREQMRGKTAPVTFELTDEQAAAFAHPEARRTVTVVGDNGQLVLSETEWR